METARTEVQLWLVESGVLSWAQNLGGADEVLNPRVERKQDGPSVIGDQRG